MTAQPSTPSINRKELEAKVAEVILIDFYHRVQFLPRGKTIDADAEAKNILKLFDQYAKAYAEEAVKNDRHERIMPAVLVSTKNRKQRTERQRVWVQKRINQSNQEPQL